jgi:hypothetical protein
MRKTCSDNRAQLRRRAPKVVGSLTVRDTIIAAQKRAKAIHNGDAPPVGPDKAPAGWRPRRRGLKIGGAWEGEEPASPPCRDVGNPAIPLPR